MEAYWFTHPWIYPDTSLFVFSKAFVKEPDIEQHLLGMSLMLLCFFSLINGEYFIKEYSHNAGNFQSFKDTFFHVYELSLSWQSDL